MYPYSPLSQTRGEIRLLDLKPADWNEDISCSLRHAELTESLEFTALSYTWGNPHIRKTILIDGCALDITVNLYNALQHMRDPKQLRTLWIDAVCINQDDLNERGKQVLRMRDIYAVAVAVEVWLGKTDDDDDVAAMDLVGRLGAVVNDPEEALAQGFDAKYQELFLEELEQCTPEVLRALGRLFKRPWWTRVWVVQELSLARQETAKVRCGKRTLPWLDFLITAYAIELSWFIVDAIISDAFPDERLDSFTQAIRMAQCRRINLTHPPFVLLELLNQHRDCEATDPRDKVFGLLGLSGDVDDIGIEPDYTSSPQEIYTDLFRKHVIATGSLDMICANRYPKKYDDLASWVPDWSTDQTVSGICIYDRYKGGNDFPGSPIAHFQKYSASGTSSLRVSFSENKMSIAAIHFGSIVSVGDVDDGMTFQDIETFGREDKNGKSGSDSETFNQWLNMVLDSPTWDDIAKQYGAENVLDAFCRTLVGNRNNRMMKPPEDLADEVHDESDDSGIGDDREQKQNTLGDAEPGDAEPGDTEPGDTEPGANESDMTTSTSSEDNAFSPPEMLSMTLDGFRSCIQVSWGKRFAILDSGHIGIVPQHALVGDMVAIVLGCTMPLVLRPTNVMSANFVGESYIHGVMDGELMDGHVVETWILE